MKLPRIAGYTYKQFPSIQLLVRDDLSRIYPDATWQELCQQLFHNTGELHLHKQTTHKSIFLMRFPPGDSGKLWVVKKYAHRGFGNIVNNMLRPSRAFHEFHTALSISATGIPTPEPLLIAEYQPRGLHVFSLLITQFIADACALKDFLIKPPSNRHLSQQIFERRKVIEAFGRLTAKIFHCGIYQDDYALNNFLVTQDQDGVKIYFIDFERAAMKQRLDDSEKTKLLAKLNRVGREITVKERLQFLSSYLKEDMKPAKELKAYARQLHTATLAQLKKDLQRRRLTCVYTSEEYHKFDTGGCRGICHKRYRPADLIPQVLNVLHAGKQGIMNHSGDGTPHHVKLVPFKKGDAEKMWAAVTALKLAGFAIDLPQGFVETKRGGCLFFNIPASGNFPDFATICKATGAMVMNLLETHFSEALNSYRDIVTGL